MEIRTFRPKFMEDFATFDAERKLVKTTDDVHAFNIKWFPWKEWPKWRKPDEWAEVSRQAHHNRDRAEAITGMGWAPKMISFAFDAETRYELMRTQAMFLYIQAPHLIGKKLEIASSKWHLNCDYCLIATWTQGILNCPLCGRMLLYSWTGD
jgi:hypothetical protein